MVEVGETRGNPPLDAFVRAEERDECPLPPWLAAYLCSGGYVQVWNASPFVTNV